MTEYDPYFDQEQFALDLQSSLRNRPDLGSPLTVFMRDYRERVLVARPIEEMRAAQDARLVWLNGEDQLDRDSAFNLYGSDFPVYFMFTMGNCRIEPDFRDLRGGNPVTTWAVFREFQPDPDSYQPIIEIKELLPYAGGNKRLFASTSVKLGRGNFTKLEHEGLSWPRTSTVKVSVGISGETVLFRTDGRVPLIVETKARSEVPPRI